MKIVIAPDSFKESLSAPEVAAAIALAALLASTRETVARTLRQLEAQHGLTRRDRWHCEIERTRLQALVAATPQ